LFTGLIENIGTVVRLSPIGTGKRLRIATDFEPTPVEGESIAVDGVCLTLTAIEKDGFSAEVSKETLDRTIIKKLKRGDKVNLERSLEANGRLGGHIVQGHVDCVGKVYSIRKSGGFAKLTVSFPRQYGKYIVVKGPVAINGVSLTVSKLDNDKLEVSLIPETLKRTTFGKLRTGSEVNLEFDILAKYVEKMIGH